MVMGGRGASYSAKSSIFYKKKNGRILELADANESNFKKFGVNAKEFQGLKTMVRDLGGTWRGDNNDKSAFMFGGNSISRSTANRILKSGRYVNEEQRRKNNELKFRLQEKLSGRSSSYITAKDTSTAGKAGRSKISKAKREFSLSTAHGVAISDIKRVKSDIAFNKRFIGKGATKEQLKEVSKLERKIKSIEREAKKHSISL